MTSMLLDQPAELTWGSFVFGSETDPDVPWRCNVLVGTEFGDPIPIVEFLQSLRQDGSDPVVTGYENRTFPVQIEFEAPDGQSMAQAENTMWAQIYAETKEPLVWTPPMVGGWPCAFDVSLVKPKRQYTQDFVFDEAVHRVRTFELEFTTSTWVRDLDPIEVPALPVPENPDEPPADVSVDECTSTAGWTKIARLPTSSDPAQWNHTMQVVSGGIRTTVTAGVPSSGRPGPSSEASPLELGATRVASVSTLGLPYLAVDVATGWWMSEPHAPLIAPDSITAPASASWVPQLHAVATVGASTVELALVTTIPTGDPTVWRYIFENPATSYSQLQVFWRVFEHDVTGDWVSGSLRYRQRQYWVRTDRVSLTDRIATAESSGFQIPRTITIEGSAPTGAAITFDAGANPLLGSTALIYTGPSEVISLRALDDGIPPGFTTDPTMMSGAWNTMNGDTVSLVPVARLSNSTYDLLGRLNFTGTAIVSWSARLVAADGSDIPGSDDVKSGEVLLRNDTADPWRIHSIASIQLPIIKVESPSTHAMEIKLWMATGGGAVKRDECWLADQRGEVTLVHEPSPFQLTKIEIQSPQLGFPRYEIMGTWADHGTQSIVRLAQLGTHEFPPGLLHIFTATDLAMYAACSLRYYRKYPWHAGPPFVEPAA